MTRLPLRVLFCLATTGLSGGVKMVFEVASRLAARGHDVEIVSFSGAPRWYKLTVPFRVARDYDAIDGGRYDLVVATNAFMVPLLWPRVAPARLVFYAQDYESFHHGPSGTYDAFVAESPAIRDVYALPVPIVASSRAVRQLIQERTGRESWYAPLGLNHAVFTEQPRRERHAPHRVLLVGNYLFPYKGIRDALDALAVLTRDLDLEAVLVTQETRDRRVLDGYPFAIEVHLRPPEAAMPAIVASADIFCCASWYEGFGLPGLEAMAIGVPVVSTRTFGVNDYGADGENLLLANPNDPADLAEKLRRLLNEPRLAARMRAAGLETARRFDWDFGIDRFEAAMRDIASTEWPMPPPDVLRAIAARLERDGCYTPIDVFREHDRIRRAIDGLCATLSAGPDAAALSGLRRVRDELSRFIANPDAQYHRAFRAEYDLCQLLLALDDRRLPGVLASRRAGKLPHAPNPASALREIRYLG